MKTNVWIWAECVCAMSKTEQYLRRANTWEHAEINWISQHYRLELMKFIVQVFATFHCWARKILSSHTPMPCHDTRSSAERILKPSFALVCMFAENINIFFCFASLVAGEDIDLRLLALEFFRVYNKHRLYLHRRRSHSLSEWNSRNSLCFCFAEIEKHLERIAIFVSFAESSTFFFLIQSSTQFADSSSPSVNRRELNSICADFNLALALLSNEEKSIF